MKQIEAFVMALVAFVAAPSAIYAATAFDAGNYFEDTLTEFGEAVTFLVPLAISIALLFFIWGLAQFILASGDEAAKDEGKRKMFWGVVALFFIVTAWGLVELVREVLGVNQGAVPITVTGNPD
jgi:uncharacterized membrane protein